ncbi:hypothetical protein BX666DRAFT_2028347 [Dichotomocladium elegans]|nr:hypothetical protein BX666DRAFT_2028346 [Dichotomocladium elegans]KAI9316120.1 hypothetical protein BX666DRAFT_2028347 [Dichotomocladium elegans]
MFEMMQEEADRTGDPIDWELTKSLWLGSDAGFLAMFRTQSDRTKVHWNDVHDTNIIRLNDFQKMYVRGSHMKFEEPTENAYRNPTNEYWRIRRYHRNLDSWDKKVMSVSYHPLIVPSVECFYPNSELLLRELDHEFDLCRGKSGDYFKKAVYIGSDPNYLRHWFSEGAPRIEYAEYIVKGKCWDDVYRNCRSDHNMFRDFSAFLRDESKRLAYDFVFCDYSTVGKIDITEELQHNYFLFKQMFHSFETLEEGGKLLVRVPSMFHQVTRDILTVFSAHFERYKILKPVATPLGCEDVYVCFDGKRFFRDNRESIVYLASLNLYYDEYNKANAIQKQTDSLTISTIFSPRERTIFEKDSQEFNRHFELTKEYMRSEFIDIQSFKMKQRLFTTKERKILTDRFFSYLEVAKAYEENFCEEPTDPWYDPTAARAAERRHLEAAAEARAQLS